MTRLWCVVVLNDDDLPYQAVGPFDDHDAAVIAALELHPSEYAVVPLLAP